MVTLDMNNRLTECVAETKSGALSHEFLWPQKTEHQPRTLIHLRKENNTKTWSNISAGDRSVPPFLPSLFSESCLFLSREPYTSGGGKGTWTNQIKHMK